MEQYGKVTCLFCRKTGLKKYGTNGVATLTKHAQSFGHVQTQAEKLTSYKLPGGRAVKNVEENSGAPPIFLNTFSTSSTKHLNQLFTHLTESTIWKQWSMPFLLSIHFLFLWLSLRLVCVKNSLKTLKLSKDSICSEQLQGLFCLVFLR